MQPWQGRQSFLSVVPFRAKFPVAVAPICPYTTDKSLRSLINERYICLTPRVAP